MADPGADEDQATKLRRASEAVKLQEAQLRLNKLRGSLVDRKAAEQHVRKLAADEREAFERFPVEWSKKIADTLGIDGHALERELAAAVRSHLELRSGVRINIASDV